MKKSLHHAENSALIKRWKNNAFVRVALYLILGVILYLFMVGNIAPEVVDVSIGSRPTHDIVSPVTVVDEEETQRKRDAAAKEVEAVYTKDDSITNSQTRELDNTFNDIKDILDDEESSASEKRQAIEEVISYDISEGSYDAFLSYPIEEIDTLRRVTTSIVYEVMDGGVRRQNDGLEHAYQRVRDSLVVSSLDERLRQLSYEMAEASIVPNYLIDQEETDRLREEARDQVPSDMIREGELIVSEGDFIDQEDIRKLRLVGMLSESANEYPYLGLALFITLIIALLAYYISFSDLSIQYNNATLLMYIVIVLINVIVMKVIYLFQTLDYIGIGFITPISLGTMLMTMLIHQRIAIFSSFIFGLLAAVLLNGTTSAHIDISYGIVTIFSGVAGAFFLGKATRKTKILQAGFVISVVTMVAICAVTLLQSVPADGVAFTGKLTFGFFNGILASILTIGLMPFFEAAFRILSPMKLIELSNPNQPLLRKILIEAPGTYHHSVMVANLAESATEAIGGNGLLARVGAYYHDVGKTKRPHFFIENQMNMENPHDKIAPHLSKTIITAHAKDGAQMLREHGLPKAIQDIAEQHHGTTLLKYFYHKAKQDNDSEVTEREFRYAGPKAQFKESAIVGIADCIEAAVRSLSKPSPERIENLVRQIIRDRLEDGQFNECDLTLKELDQVARAMCETLQGIFHSRIEYPEDKDKATQKTKHKDQDQGQERADKQKQNKNADKTSTHHSA
ncbi:HD family phosphohydrolase [Caldalkalibacillus salinus]|uniref:HD family phosphohydrolase n=1 Tax=Caldalkalibacillus salinus TaxID=2803787 RepID=UPI00192320D0|nr:HD family phosphohydrolase [Caldalkalibacillus salinus]